MWTRSRSVRETFVRMAEDFFHEPAAASALVAASAFLFSRRGEWTSGQAVRAALNLSGQFELVATRLRKRAISAWARGATP
jgi:hypothetical protein